MTEKAFRLMSERWPYLFVTSVLLVGDRMSKAAVSEALLTGESRVILAGFLDLVHFQNTGVAFGVFDGVESAAKVVLLSGLAAAAALIVVIYSIRTPAGHVLLQSSLALILGGALGNLYDRVTLGYVVDFLYFHVGDFYWPAFNLADSAITVGVGLLGVDILQHEIRNRS